MSGLVVGENIFQWTVDNGPCANGLTTDQVSITVFDENTAGANAGPDQELCTPTSTTNLQGSAVAGPSTGSWTLISGTGTIADPNDPNTLVSGLSVGENIFEWAVDNGPCANGNTTDQVSIFVFDGAQAVADAGCGTGILAIAAVKSGADQVVAFDTDEWAVENTRENITLNGCENMEVSLGDAALLRDKAGSFDIILANIQLNVLLNDLKVYALALRNRGIVFMSGFYEEDISVLTSEALKYRLELFSEKKQNNWAALGFKKL